MIESKKKLHYVLMRWFILLSIISTVLSMFVYIVSTYGSLKSFAFENICSVRDQQAQLIDNWFQERTDDVKRLSLCSVVKEKNLEGINKLFNEQLSQFKVDFESFTCVDADGHILIGKDEGKDDISVADRDYYKLAMEGKGNVSEVIQSRITGNPVVIVACPVFSDEGEITGLVFGSLNLDKLDKISSYFHIGKTGEIYLVDKKGLMVSESRFTPLLVKNGIVNSTSKYNFQVKSEAVERLRQGEKGYAEYKNYLDCQVLGAFKGLDNYEWGVVVEIERDEIIGTVFTKICRIAILFLTLYILIVYPLAKHIAFRVVSPIINMANNIAHFAKDYQEELKQNFVTEESPYEEAKILNDAFYKMSKKMSSLMETLKIQALYDPLTGLANRRQLFQRGQEMIEVARRKQTCVSLIYFDIDNFKGINDNYGHDGGDEVLVHIAEMMGNISRVSDVAGRVGGDEFAIILPETDMEGAQLLAERFRKYVEETLIEIGNIKFNITISVGMSTFIGALVYNESSVEILGKLIHQSDKAMYKAKGKGRNCIEISMFDNGEENYFCN
ncbi:MAG: sensor domain-containing diguanylate cyclase [Clostridia bacterium]|nr:sensor domain-containing diguanylate cyclase [Clostridia bacterium]